VDGAVVTIALAGTLVGAVALSVAVILLALPLLRRSGVVDIPGDRSMHATPTPRGGGVGVVAAALVCLVAATPAMPQVTLTIGRDLAVALLPIVAMAAIGLLDDVRNLAALPRLGAQLVVAASWVAIAPVVAHRNAAWVPLAVIGTIVLVNITNFMDGINGLVSGHAVITSAWYAVVALVVDLPAAALLAVAVLGGSLGFLPFNVPQARVFLGDVGSYGLGAAWAVLSLWLLLAGAPPECVIAPLVILLADSLITLLRRMLNGDRVFEPHRMHVYQRHTHAGWSHVRTSGLVLGLTLLCTVLAIPALMGAGRQARLAAFAGMLALAAFYMALPRLRGGRARWESVASDFRG
jgi:UDP-GlcNAc:undecaprenyl-phosphate GlcNAc-1-phosphate transferase